MHRILALVFAAFLMAFASPAQARKIRWQKIAVRSGKDAPQIEKKLSRLLKAATKRAKWGRGDTIKLSARLTKMTWERHDDVLKVSVTVVAKIIGGRGARSHIRIGGRPKNKAKLEKEALKIVADGLITRLSDMARTEAKEKEKAKAKEKAEAEAEKKREEDDG